LDLILTNSDFINDVDHLSPLGKGDHEILTFNCNTSNISRPSTHKLNYNKDNYDALRNHLDINNWESILLPHKDNIEEMWNIFTSLLRSGTELHISQHNNFCDWKKPSWSSPLPHSVRATIKKKHRLWTRFIETGETHYLSDYKKNA